MDDSMIIGIASTVGVGMGLALYNQKLRATQSNLGPPITNVLRSRGPSTLAEVANALGRGGIFGRGKVFSAIQQMASDGVIEIIPAPEGTPQLKKVELIRYRMA